ncbi:MAG: radical SAM protein, partial [Smithellaceae bacterium]|nr:radical SAM protein [Smithellaceae bacterium]
DSVSFGVESGCPETLKRVRKGITLAQAAEAVRMCKLSGMLAHASFMVGLPGETKETLQQTDDFARSLDIMYGYHYLAPFPGTTLCEKVERYDLQILTRDWSKYDANDAIVKTSGLLPQDIRDFVARYEAEVNGDWQKVVDNYNTGINTPHDDLRVEGEKRTKITYAVLKEDLVENLGVIEPSLTGGGKDAVENLLIERMKASISGDPLLVEKTLRDFMAKGYLSADFSDKGCVWRWT